MQSIKSENAKIPMKELCAVRMDFLPNTAISTKILPKLPISSDVVGYPKTQNLRGKNLIVQYLNPTQTQKMVPEPQPEFWLRLY